MRKYRREKFLTYEEINEGFKDDLRAFRDKASKSVKDFFGKFVKVGKILFETINGKLFRGSAPLTSFTAIANGAVNGVIGFPTKGMIEEAAQNGVNLPKGDINQIGDADAVREDVDDINEFWDNVIERYHQTDESLMESYQGVASKRYGIQILNEARGEKTERESMADLGVDTFNLTELTEEIELMLDEKITEDLPIPMTLFIWGAPGVGKTEVTKHVVQNFGNGGRVPFEVLTVCGMQGEDFRFPIKDEIVDSNGERQIVARDIPKAWIPCYEKSKNESTNIERNNIANNIRHTKGDIPGGVIFLDEFSRVGHGAANVFMTLLQSREIDNYKLGSKWSFICAGNGASVLDKDLFDIFDTASYQRFKHLYYVPEFEEWAPWAAAHGVRPEILRFLKAHPEFWLDLSSKQMIVGNNPRAWVNTEKLTKRYEKFRKGGSKLDLTNDDDYKKFKSHGSAVSPEAMLALRDYLKTEALINSKDVPVILNDGVGSPTFNKIMENLTEKLKLMNANESYLMSTDLINVMMDTIFNNLRPEFETFTLENIKNLFNFMFYILIQNSDLVSAFAAQYTPNNIVNRLMSAGCTNINTAMCTLTTINQGNPGAGELNMNDSITAQSVATMEKLGYWDKEKLATWFEMYRYCWGVLRMANVSQDITKKHIENKVANIKTNKQGYLEFIVPTDDVRRSSNPQSRDKRSK